MERGGIRAPVDCGRKGTLHTTSRVYTNLSTGVVLLYLDLMEWRRVGGDGRIPPMNCARERSLEKKGSDYRYTERNRREKLKIFRGEGS